MVFAAAIMLASCGKPENWAPTYPPDFFANWSDRQKERFPELQTIFGPSCLWAMAETEDCFKMTEPRRWTGLWRTDFEESRFCADSSFHGPAEVCDDRHSDGEAWLRGDDRLPGEADHAPSSGQLYRIEFVGRRTEYPGYFGHLNQYDYEMVIDRMIAKKPLTTGRGEAGGAQPG